MSDERKKSDDLAHVAFGEVLSQISDETIEKLIARFEAAAQIDEDESEYWFARDLQGLLGYTKWANFVRVIADAKTACVRAGHSAADHFADVGKMISLGKGAGREVDDVVLSRYACYLVAQNADAKKRPVAFAQTYFAIQTRRQEIREQEEREYRAFPEEERRIMLREEIKTHNKRLVSAAKSAGVRDRMDYAIFQTEGCKGLYGGLDVPGIRRRKGLKAKQVILDHMGSTELAANLFRATQTEEKLRREQIQGKEAANKAHYEVGRKVRDAIADIGGDMPEELPPAEDVKKVERRLKRERAKREIGG